MTADTRLLPDTAMIRAAWEAINGAGETREIRIPSPRRSEGRRPRFYRSQAGWFDDADAVVRAVGNVSGDDAESVYLTVNPTLPELRARANNRLADAKSTTTDDAVTRLAYLFVDIDAQRVAGIPATDEEKAGALAQRDAVAEYLCDFHGWPAPFMVGDSGNGGALLYRIALDNTPDNADVLRRVLESLSAIFPMVDRTTFNPSRIMKLPGTIAAKGDGLPDRPWRRASAVFDKDAGVVSLAQLEAVAAEHVEAPRPVTRNANGTYDGPPRDWTVEELLSLNNLPIRPRQTRYGLAFDLDRCLTSNDHTDGACIIEAHDGRLGYKCQHNSCAGRDWKYLREHGLIQIPTSHRVSLNGQRPKGATDQTNDAPATLPPKARPEPLAEEAFHGLAGDIVRAVEPHTEADPAGLLFTLLAAVGNAVGTGPHWSVSGSRHGLRLFTVLVGESSKARKGTTFGSLRPILQGAAPEWYARAVQSGLSSGEGLIWAVRDQIEKQTPIKEKGIITGYQSEIVDPGVDDKRLLVFEEEFASTLRVMGRDGNSLSGVIRQAWDHGDLNTMTKNNPAKATGAHISIVGHTTQDELLRYLNDTEAANGFANRFMWVAVQRSKQLPDGGNLHPDVVLDLAAQLRDVFEHSSRIGCIERDAEANAIWRQVYGPLSDGGMGLLGAITSRAEAQVMRIAAIYAVLDKSTQITPAHLMAGLAVWKYAEDSAGYIFGDAMGDPIADQALRALRSTDGLTRTEISNLFGRHVSSGRLDHALGTLLAAGKVIRESESTSGRPREVWRAA